MSEYKFHALIEFNFDASSVEEAEEMYDAVFGDMGFWVGRQRMGSAIVIDSTLVDSPIDDFDEEEDDDE